MKRCLFLIPTTYNDGSPVPSEQIANIYEELFVNFGGFSQGGITNGLWKMADGSEVKDQSLTIWIVITDEKVVILKELVKKFCKLLKQEAIYFEIMECDIEFIGPE